VKICFIATSPYAVRSFLEPHINNLSISNDITLLTNTSSNAIQFNFINVNIINIPIKRKLNIVFDILVFFKLLKFFYSNNFDVVHTITPKAGLIGSLASWFCKVPNRLHTFTGQHWQRKVGLMRYIYKFLDKQIFIKCTCVFADGKNQILEIEKELNIPKGSIKLLGPGSISGVNLKRFKPSLKNRNLLRMQIGVSPNTFVLLFVGRLCTDKGVNDIITAANFIQNLNVSLEIWFVGPDEEDIENYLKTNTKLNKLILKFFGEKNNPEIFMQASDVLIMPSYREGFGSVLIEANACAIPVICYDIYGVRDAVQSGVNGFLVEVGNINILTDKIRYMIENYNERLAMGNNGLVLSRKFDELIVTSAWADYYKDLTSIKK